MLLEEYKHLKGKEESNAINELKKIQKQPVPPAIQAFLKIYENGTDISYNNFITGINKFTEYANVDFDTRHSHFGNCFWGLHYGDHLATKWNERNSDNVKTFQLDYLRPEDWDFFYDGGYFAFQYKGKTPAKAFDSFVKGPSVIDCGMFTQLSIWFGIRYILGNNKFNQLFGNTLSAHDIRTSIGGAWLSETSSSLLNHFFSGKTGDSNSVKVCYLENHIDYLLKHPGGIYGGENCLEIGGEYTVFDPPLEHTHGLSQENIQSLLADAFNGDLDINDTEMLEIYRKADPAAIRIKSHSDVMSGEKTPHFDLTYQQLIDYAEKFKNTTISKTDCGQVESVKYFDLGKFQNWLLMK